MARKKKCCTSGVGGQAVLEGVMMKNKESYAVAVRKPDGEIDVDVHEYHGVLHGSVLTRIPFVRGVFNFADSLILGMRTLNHSLEFYEDEEASETGIDRAMDRMFGAKAEKVMSGITVVISLIIAIALFMILPYYLSRYFEQFVMNSSLLAIIEGAIRLVIFLIYIVVITAMKDIRRLYMYHGAEHKCINCIEQGMDLTVANVRKSSRLHRRCGTSFLLFVMLISIILFMFIRTDSTVLRLVFRVLLIPVIAGISYEVLKLAGRTDNIIMKILSAPGMLLQRLTTKEPDDDMIEIGIKAVEAVFDWKAFLKENFEKYAEAEENEEVAEVLNDAIDSMDV